MERPDLFDIIISSLDDDFADEILDYIEYPEEGEMITKRFIESLEELGL